MNAYFAVSFRVYNGNVMACTNNAFNEQKRWSARQFYAFHLFYNIHWVMPDGVAIQISHAVDFG